MLLYHYSFTSLSWILNENSNEFALKETHRVSFKKFEKFFRNRKKELKKEVWRVNIGYTQIQSYLNVKLAIYFLSHRPPRIIQFMQINNIYYDIQGQNNKYIGK